MSGLNEVAFKSPVKFRFIICKDDELKDKEGLTATIGQNANLVHHLNQHEQFRFWKKKYDEYREFDTEDDGMSFFLKVNIILFIIRFYFNFSNESRYIGYS